MDAFASTIDVDWNQRRLAVRCVALLTIAVAIAVAAVGPSPKPAEHIAFAVLALSFGALAITALRRLIVGAPALTLERGGFRSAKTTGLVPWSAIQSVTPPTRAPFLILALKPEAKGLIRPTLVRRLGLARHRLMFETRMLDVDPVRLMQMIQARTQADQEGASLIDPEVLRLAALAAGPPVFAYALIGLLSLILLAEWVLRLNPSATPMSIDVMTLWGLGADQRDAVVRHGQIWRIVTATLLHGGLLHLFGNALALWFAARLLERLIGWRWFAAIFAISALSGSLLSLVLNPPGMVGVGASGGIVGLAAATAIIASHFPAAVRVPMVTGGLRIVMPALLPFIATHRTAGGAAIDVAAHAGGAFGGALVALLILITWRTGDPQPGYKPVAATIAAMFFAVAAASLIPITGTYAVAKATIALAPRYPHDFKQAMAQSSTLLASYPRDPRLHAAHAEALVAKGDIASAENELERALDDRPMLVPEVTSVEPYLRVRLAQLLVSEDKTDAAARVLQPTCGTTTKSLRAAIDQMALCHHPE
jgi:membrane associated rhomboid family serine protease